MWNSLVWAERSTPGSFWVPSHRFNSATGEQKWITQTIYTNSEPPSRLPNSLMQAPSWEGQTSQFLRLWCDAVRNRTPASRTPSGRSNHCATQGWSWRAGLRCRCVWFNVIQNKTRTTAGAVETPPTNKIVMLSFYRHAIKLHHGMQK